MSKKYNFQFLEDKLGQFDKEFKYPRISLIEGSLFYIEKETKKELEDEIKSIKLDESLNPTYIWGYVSENDAIYVTRTFGENKVFIYNPRSMKKTEYVKGKLKVLNELQRDTVDNLFDQKAVFEYFYKKLWDLRLELGREIRDKNGIPDNVALMEAQHIIDRIIFTYFICEKELLSIKDYGPVTGKELFSDVIGQLPDTWNYLKKLFFVQFAKSGANDLDCGGDVYVETPYLNGGLFRPKIISKISEEDLKIEYEWNNIFDPLNKYSWIVEDEITDLEGEYEGNLTPEIIGHIYEKFVITIETLDEINLDELNTSKSGDLRKGNKKIGAYYTPEPITDYISRNTITPIIYGKLGISENIEFQEFVKNADYETLLNAQNILEEITICDPACGSGAFLLKAGEILLEYNIIILKNLKTRNINYYNLKKGIIINNLYGVDIQDGAVEICKLRLWLWLISSSKTKKAEPLPNIEYNFTIGNSLVGWASEKLNQSVLIKIDEMVLVILDALEIHYKDHNIEAIKEKLQKTDMQSYADAMSLLKKIYSYASDDEAEQLKNVIESIKKVIYEKINGVFYNHIKAEGTKITRDEYDDLNPFHWKIDFSNIFESGGFDVVIGNPPYLTFSRVSGSKGMEKTLVKSYKQYLIDNYPHSAEYKISTYAVFMNRGIVLLKNKGIISYITPDSFLIGRYFSKLRNYIIENCKIEKIVLFCEDFWKVGVIGFPVIFIIQREDEFEERNTNMIKAIKTKKLNAFVNKDFKSYTYEQSYFNDIEYNRFRLFFDSFSKYFVEKVESPSIKAGEIVSLHVGIRPKIGYKKISAKSPKDNKWKKGIITGSEITRFNINYEGNYINLDPGLLWAGGYDDNVIGQKKLLMRKTGDSLIVALDEDKLYHLDILHSIVLKDKKYNLKYIMAIFNSKLMNHYYHLITLSSGRTMAQTNMETIEKLPIYPADISTQESLSNNVESIIELKKSLTNETNKFNGYLKDELGIKKFPKKLKTYYNITFDDFIKILKSNKIIFELDELQLFFETSCKKIEELNDKIFSLDSQINNLIYDVYGLNENDIEIINSKFIR